MVGAIQKLLIAIVLLSPAAMAQNWRMQPTSIPTPWAASVSPANVWPEYPRPQMVRSTWQNLNGLWEYAISARDAQQPEQYAGQILVPFPLESALSGVKQSLRPDQTLWYRRTIQVQPGQAGERVLLHFGAVDYEATVYVNGKRLGTHSGGYQSFTFEITGALQPGDNQLVVKVYDPTDQGPNPHGKQNLHAQWMYYSPSSGIWQTVWLERVPSTYVDSLELTPNVDQSEVLVAAELNGPREEYSIEATIHSNGKLVARQLIDGSTAIKIDQPQLWSPDDPHLYDLRVRLLHKDRVVDTVQSYFGMRKIALKMDPTGRARIFLNDRETFNLGVVDQGYWPDGLYTAPSDAALKFDVQTIKALGFNTVRKHMKIEPQRWYYYCDLLGLLVWQDMPSSNNDSPQARAHFEREIKQNLAQLHNHPSITTWVLFNEGWGAYDQERLARWMMQTDPSRLLNGHSGPYDHVAIAQWEKRQPPSKLMRSLGNDFPTLNEFQALQDAAPVDWMVGNMLDLHYYPGPRMLPAQANVASVTGEHGSFGVYIEGHAWNELLPVGLGVGRSDMTPPQMLEAYAASIEQLKTLQAQGLSGAAFFQLADVETEQQGLLTYDRAVAKVPVHEIQKLNAKLVPQAKNYVEATRGFAVENAQWTPEPQRYQSLITEFRRGRRDLAFLQRLSLMALRQQDQPGATEFGNAFVAQAPQPYTTEAWKTIFAITRTTKDSGFQLFRKHAEDANAALAPQAAQKKYIDILLRELIAPQYKSQQHKVDWENLERTLTAGYGELAREAVYGARMMDAFLRQDWPTFGSFYVRYFETATGRSPYQVHSLSYQVLVHVSDRKALETALRVMRWQLDSPREAPVFGQYDPTELDTYANLLYKMGRSSEALEWQSKAVSLSFGRDREILGNLEKMKRGMRVDSESVRTGQ